MSVSPVGAAQAVTRAATTSTQAATGSQSLSQQDFLNLLMTQLSNQDPLSPQDDKEFISEMAQFSSLEGTQTMSQGIDKLQGASLLGKMVAATLSSNGSQVPVAGVVTAVSYDSSGVKLTVNNQTVPLASVTQVSGS